LTAVLVVEVLILVESDDVVMTVLAGEVFDLQVKFRVACEVFEVIVVVVVAVLPVIVFVEVVD
jgi:hypothetical protein